MSSSPPRLAFLGGLGHHYLRLVIPDTTIDLEAVAVTGDGRDDEAARRLADAVGSSARVDVKWFDSPGELLDTFKPDVVSVGTIYGHNGELAAQALAHGAAVVSDKPIAATWEQFQALQELTSRADARPLITEFPFRATNAFVAAHRAVREGAIGKVVLASAQKSYRWGNRPRWYANRADYGGTVLWVASHGIDVIRFVTGQRFVRVWGRGGNIAKPDYGSMEDHTVTVFELDGGGTALVHADLLRPAKAATHGDDRLRIVGSNGLIEVRDGRCTLTTNDAPEIDITDRGAGEPVYRQLWSAALGQPSDRFSTQASLESAAFLLHARDATDQQTVIEIR